MALLAGRAAGQPAAVPGGGLIMNLCLLDLVQLTGGQLRLAAMPPRDGELAALGKIVLDAAVIQPGDVFWCLACPACDVEMAFLRGAMGIVISQRSVEPWPGRFCVLVEDAVAALARVIEGMRDQESEEFGVEGPELKVLQLSGESRVDIYPPTCGRVTKGQTAKGQLDRRCRRRAA
jgi:hypothetical protein